MVNNKTNRRATIVRGLASIRILVPFLAAIVITAILYWRSLSLPFYSDDLVQIPWLRDLTFAELWGRVSPYDYYRPLAFSLWLLIRPLGWTPSGLRLINLALHAIASMLVGLLAGQFSNDDRPFIPVSAAILFAAYPFAYQAVPWVSAIFYPLVVALSVGAVVTYLRFRRRNQKRWLIASLILTVLAPFAHENGMLVGGLVILAEIALRLENRSQFSRWPATHLGIGIAFAILWFNIRSGGVSTLDLSLSNLSENARILSLGLSYPLAPLATSLDDNRLLFVMVWAVFLAALIPTLWLVKQSRGAAIFSLGWFALSIGPALVTMRPAWLLDAPRFLYPAGVGAAIWWTMAIRHIPIPKIHSQRQSSLPCWLLHADWDGLPLRWQWQPISIVILMLALLPGAIFSWEGVGWHLRGTQPIYETVEYVEAHPDTPLLVLNLPERVAPARSALPYFDGGAILLPPQVPQHSIIQVHTGRLHPSFEARYYAPPMRPTVYWRGIYGDTIGDPGEVLDMLSNGGAVLLTEYGMNGLRLIHAGEYPSWFSVDSVRPYIASYDGYNILEMQSTSGFALLDAHLQQNQLTLQWGVAEVPDGVTIFVHVVDDNGNIVAQADGDPYLGLLPLSALDEGVIAEKRFLDLPSGGPYELYVGVWMPETGERLIPDAGGDGRIHIGPVPGDYWVIYEPPRFD